MSTNFMHPSEFAYAFSYAGATQIIGWDQDYFLPTADTSVAPENWLVEGEKRLVDAGRLTGSPENGLNFIDEMTAQVLALVNPSLVLQAERKEGDGLRRLTVHVSGNDFVGLNQRTDGLFDVTRYTDITSASGACAGFLGASLDPLLDEARIEASYDEFADLRKAATSGQLQDVVETLCGLGISDNNARSAANALGNPSASGMLTVFYCANNEIQDAEPYAVMTNQDDHTWVLFPPASLNAPLVLERSSVASLTARVAVEVASRFGKPD